MGNPYLEAHHVAGSMLELLLKYFKTVKPLQMVFHLLFVIILMCVLSVTYIITFHFTPIMDLWQRSRSIEHFRNELSISLAIDTQINDQLQLILSQTQADRAYVFRYHNGVPSVNGIPFIFHSNTHEVIRPGVTRVSSLMQRIPSSINVHMNQEFAKGSCITILDVDKDPTSHDYWYFQARGSRHMIRCAIYTSKNDLLGFVGLDYLNNFSSDMTESTETRLRESASAMGNILHRN
jgi:hypothetical protein